MKSDSLAVESKISIKRGESKETKRYLLCLFLIPPQLNPKVKLFRLAIHYSRLICRNYFADGKLPLKRQLKSHKYAMWLTLTP